MEEKLSQMSADEFLQHGLDFDTSVEEETLLTNGDDQPRKKENKSAGTTGAAKHKNQLEGLKEKDPEFYKFLQENDEELLAFSESDDDENDDEKNSIDGDDQLDEKRNKVDTFEDSEDEMSEDELSGDEQKKSTMDESDKGKENYMKAEIKEGKKVTESMIKRWKTGLEEEESLKILKCLFHAFHAAVQSLSPEEGGDEKPSKPKKIIYSVDSGSMYNNLMKMCLKYSVKILEKHLTSAKQKKFKKNHLPSSNKLWSSIKVPLKQYLLNILQLLRVHTDVSVLTILLRHSQALSPYYACFPKISKMFLKRLTRMWSSGEEHVRVAAFLCIRSLSLLLPNLFEYVLKKLYLGFVRNSKFVNLKTKPTIIFMKNSLVEMFSYNEAATYKHGFLYIRQLAITLRNAINIKKKDAFQSVYNWQYVNCLQLWSQVISDLHGDVLKPLVYPIVQINIGVIKLIPAARYYPLRFHCIDSLNYISKKTGVYIPTATFILQAIESGEFLKKPKSSEKPPDFSGLLKLSKSQLQTKGFQDCIIDLSLESLMEHYVIFSNSIAFPELIFPVCHRLKRFIKNKKAFKLCKDMRMLIEKLKAHGDTIKNARDEVTFSPKDVELVKKWEEERKLTKNSLGEFLETWRNMKQLSDSIASSHEEEDSIPLKKVKNKEKKRQSTTQGEDNSNIPVTKKKKRNIDKERNFDGDVDVVEDYRLSDDDDDV